MPRHTIFWPVLCLVLWTFLVLVQVPIRRFHAAFKGRVVAAGSLDAVRAGESLQRRFLDLLGVAVPSEGVLTWLQSSSGSN